METMQFLAGLQDRQGRIDWCNDALLRLSGYGREDVMGKNWFDLFVPAEERELGRTAYLAGNLQRESEGQLQTASGERRVIQWNIMPLREGGCAALGVDVTERSRAATKLLHDAFHDSLTALPNRALFMDRLSHRLALEKRCQETSLSVFFLDVAR